MDDEIQPIRPISSDISVRKSTRIEDFGRRLGIRVALIAGRFRENAKGRTKTAPKPQEETQQAPEPETPAAPGHIDSKA